MSFEFAGYQQRSERFQQELDAPMEDVLGATAEQALTESPVNSILRFSELANANVSQDRLDAVAARQRLKDAGLEGRLTIPDAGIATPALDILMDRKKEEIRRQDILSRAPRGFAPGAQQFGIALAASALDPVNLGLAFVPVVGEARYLRYLANARGIFGRTAVRAGVGAAEGAVGAAIAEPLIYAAKSQEQADYDMQDSLLNIAFGTVFGGGLHVLGGLASDAGKALSPVKVARERIEPTIKFDADSPAARVDAMPLPEREVAMRTAVSQAMTGKAVDVDSIVPPVDSGAREALTASSRNVRVGESRMIEPDPIAQDVLRSKDFLELEKTLAQAGLRDLKPLAGGASSVVLDAGESVVRLGVGELAPRAPIGEMLQPTTSGKVGNLRYEILPKAETTSITDADVKAMHAALEKQGYEFSDPGTDNLGRFQGKSVVIDPGAVRRSAQRQASPESEVTADVPAAEAADRQIAETSAVPDPVAEQEALLADDLLQLKDAARVADIDVGDELAEFDEAIKLADEYGKAARAAVICGMAH